MNTKTLLLLALAGSLACNLAALFFQHVMGILPCHLCILQRYPHWALTVLGLALLAFGRGTILRLGAFLGALIALGNAVLAVYHSGVERKLWAGPADCTGGQDLSGLSGNDLLSLEVEATIIMCDEISYTILGLSFANWNVVVSLALAGLWMAVARRA